MCPKTRAVIAFYNDNGVHIFCFLHRSEKNTGKCLILYENTPQSWGDPAVENKIIQNSSPGHGVAHMKNDKIKTSIIMYYILT